MIRHGAPVTDGLDLIREARGVCPDVRILAISGGGRYLAPHHRIKLAKGLGAHGLLMKPFTEEQLLCAVKAALEIRAPSIRPFY